MADIPVTSVSLLRTLAGDSDSERWNEFYRKYQGSMESFLRAKFPSLEPEDVIQETMMSLARRLPDYRYLPDEKGHFRNYLTGILKHKAMDALSKRSKEAALRQSLAAQPSAPQTQTEDDGWKRSAMEVAIAQLLADESVNPLHRTIFRHVALEHERPESVAERFGITRGNVDVIKKRMIDRLARLVTQLTSEDS